MVGKFGSHAIGMAGDFGSDAIDHIESDTVGGHVDGAIDTVGHLGSMAGSAIGNFFGNLGWKKKFPEV